ncbi:MAG: flagellar hook-associated protein FlgK [Ilumatobacteraceae bacterium]
MPSISSLYTALSGLTAQQRTTEVVSHNVANQATPGYRRQRVDLIPVAVRPGFGDTGNGTRTGGVLINGVSQSRDELIAARAIREQGALKTAEGLGATLGRLEQIYAEPGDLGIASQLQALWTSFNDVANQPGSVAARTQLLQQADALTQSLHNAADTISGLRTVTSDRIAGLADQVNTLATELARLNASITSTPTMANDLRDRRDMLVTQLSELTGAQPHTTASGQFDLTVGGRSLVTGDQVYRLDGTGGALTWVADGRPVNAARGEAAALVTTMNDIVPRYTAALDAVAATLVQDVNALHSTGFDQQGITGRNFFDPAGVTAATIQLSVDVDGLPGNIAAGAPVPPLNTAPGPLDGDLARQIARLADSTIGADSTYRSMVGSLAVESRAAEQATRVQSDITDAAVQDDASVSSVSLDEEMSQLVTAQRAYEASARVLTAVDDMLGILIERTGLVGR